MRQQQLRGAHPVGGGCLRVVQGIAQYGSS
jgi:hypothetical protein